MKVKDNSLIKSVMSGSFLYVIISFIEVVLFALLLQKIAISKEIIKWVNQALKTIALFICCFIFINGEKGLLKGSLMGLLGGAILLGIFYIFGINSFSFYSFFIEVAFCIVVGGIFGIMAVNIKSK